MPRAISRWILVTLGAAVLAFIGASRLQGEARIAAASIPAALIALFCVGAHLPAPLDAARRPWMLSLFALAAWMLFDLGAFFRVERGLAVRGLECAWLAALFGALVLALDAQPQLASPPEFSATRAMERVGAVIFAFGLLFYVSGPATA